MRYGVLSLWVLLLAADPLPAQQFDPTNFVVVGGGLSAGYGDFRLTAEFQRECYPARMARQMGTIMPVPLFRPATTPSLVALDPLSQVIPPINQSVLRSLPFPLFTFNLSIPWIRVAESLDSRPVPPLVQEGDLKQSLINLILGYPSLILEEPFAWSQIEYAENMAPTFVIVELGFGDVADAVITGDPTLITPAASFDRDFRALVSRLERTHATLLLMTVPDPTRTAFLCTVNEAAGSYDVVPAVMASTFELAPDDLVNVGGMVEIGDYLRGRRENRLSPNSVLRVADVQAIRQAVASYNSTVRSVAAQGELLLFDLQAFTEKARVEGIRSGAVDVSAGYGEGFYTEDGMFLSPTAHALLANELLRTINARFNTDYEMVDVEAVAQTDPFGKAAVSAQGSARRQPRLLPIESRQPLSKPRRRNRP